MTDPATPPCLSDEPLPAAVREADGMLGMWAELFRYRRVMHGVDGALELAARSMRDVSDAEVRNLLYAALIRLTEPKP
jgi:hypothetical protein